MGPVMNTNTDLTDSDASSVKPKPVAMVTIASKPSSTSIDAQVEFDEMQQRYTTSLNSASWMGVVRSGFSATKADGDQMVLEGMSAQNMMMLEPLLATEMSRHARLHFWQQSEVMLLCLNVEHAGCNQQLSVHKVISYLARCLFSLVKWILFLEKVLLLQKMHYCFAQANNLKVDLFQSSQWDSTSISFLLNSSSGNASLLPVGTASWRAQNSLLHERKVVDVAHISMTAWFNNNLVSVLVLSKPLVTVGLLRIGLNWYTARCIELQPCPWPSFTIGVPKLAIWKCYYLSRKSPWPPPSHQYFRIVQAENVGSWKYLSVITERRPHVLVQENVGLFQSSQGTTLFLSEASKLKWMWPMLQAPWSPSLLFEINGGEAQLNPFCTSYTTRVFWTTSRSLPMMVTGWITSKLDIQWLVADDQLRFCNSQCTVAGLLWFQVIWLLPAFVLPPYSAQLKRGGLPQFDSLLLSNIWPEKKHQLLRSSDGKLLVGGVASPIYAQTIICVSFGAIAIRDYPYDMLLKPPWPPPVLLHLTHASAIMWPTQWPSSCCYEADKKSKFLLFQVSNHGLKFNSITKLLEAAWGQAAFQGEGNVRYRHQMGCLSNGPRPSRPRNRPE